MKKKEHINDIRQELKQLGSSLDPADKQTGFEVPANYFEQLPAAVQDTILQRQKKPAPDIATLFFKRVIPLTAATLLLVGAVFSLFLLQKDGLNNYYAAYDQLPELEYFVYNTEFDKNFIYQMVLETDIMADDLYFDQEFAIFDDEEYVDILEEMFENAAYYGMESNYLLSYFD